MSAEQVKQQFHGPMRQQQVTDRGQVPPGEGSEGKMMNLWAEKNNKVGRNQSIVINTLFPIKKV